MRKIGPRTSREELAAIISEHLKSNGLEAVLVGGSVVSIYTDDYFVSDDLDFVAWKKPEVRQALKALGFTDFTGNTAKHPRARFFVQIVNGPVQVGRKHIKVPATRSTRWGEIRLLSPLDCVLDRLGGFLHWNDRQCLVQAAYVASKHNVDLDAVRAWIEREEGDQRELLERCEEFKARVGELKDSGS
jgi:hypothetical protein